MWKIKNNYGQYIFKTDKIVSFTSKDNATVFTDEGVCEEYVSRLRLFYAGEEFKTEKI